MSEQARSNPEQPTLPDMELVRVVEGMKPEQRIEEKRRLLSEISDRERLVHLINDVNDAEGIDVTIIY